MYTTTKINFTCLISNDKSPEAELTVAGQYPEFSRVFKAEVLDHGFPHPSFMLLIVF
jgi:hypothetical protein